MQEIEIKFLNITPELTEQKLKKHGAEKLSDELLEEWIYRKHEWEPFHGRVRIRKSSKITTLSYKETTKKTSEGNPEIEFSVDDWKQAMEFIEKLRIPLARHQQKRRIHYQFEEVSIDIDYWPLIPPMIEIEGPILSKLYEVAGFLDLGKEVAIDALQIHQEIYGIDLSGIKEMVFTKDQLARFPSSLFE